MTNLKVKVFVYRRRRQRRRRGYDNSSRDFRHSELIKAMAKVKVILKVKVTRS